MPIVIYQVGGSPPCRTVFMTAEALGIELVKKHMDFKAGDFTKPEYLAINPQHTVPTMDDNGFILWESRAMAKYLVNKYAPDSPIYPKDPKARALVDQVLDFDLANIFPPLLVYAKTLILEKRTPEPEKVENIMKSVAIVEKLLSKTPYVAGNHMTLADYSILSSLVYLEMMFDFSFTDYPKVTSWLEKMRKESPKYEEIHEIPLKEYRELLKNW